MNDQPLVERPEQKFAQFFRDMADRIEHNKGGDFGGACVIVPPGDLPVIEFLQLGTAPDLGQFYGAITTRVQIVLQQIQEKQRVGMNFGMR